MTIKNFDRWIYRFTEPNQIQPELGLKINPNILEKFGEPIDRLFPDFAREFPRTVSAMKRHWSAPKLIASDNLLAYLVLERDGSNLFFDILTNLNSATDDPEYLSYFSMLPPPWRELYRTFNSFKITPLERSSMFWTETPFSYTSRIHAATFYRHEEHHSFMETQELAEMYIKFTDFNANEFDAFVATLTDEPTRLNCWCVNDALDTLWIDEQHNDGVVHYVRRGDFTNPIVLKDPGRSMDCYLAHLVAGESVHEFDFSTC